MVIFALLLTRIDSGFAGTVFVFRATRADRVKLLVWDSNGLVMFYKKFRWSRIEGGVMRLSPAQLSALLEGIDSARVHSRRVARPTATQ